MPKSLKALKGSNIRVDKCFDPFNLSLNPKIRKTETLRKVTEKFFLAANKTVTKKTLEQKICNTCRLKLLTLSMKKDEERQSDQEVRLLFYFIVRF